MIISKYSIRIKRGNIVLKTACYQPNKITATDLIQLELYAAVSGHLCQRQLIETGEQQLHIGQKGVQSNGVVCAQRGVQTAIQTCLLVDVKIGVRLLLGCKTGFGLRVKKFSSEDSCSKTSK